MVIRKFIAYFRVSTQQQGLSGLGLEAQQVAVRTYLNSVQGDLVAQFSEIETGKGSNALDKRPQLRAALDLCRKQKATLIIAKLDRLARNVHFVSGLLESGCDFVAADIPQANKVMLQMYSVMAEFERDQISARTKAALQAAKARGVKLGTAGPANLRPNIEQRQLAADAFSAKLRPMFEGMQARQITQRAMVAELNSIGVPAPRGGTWQLAQIQRILKRISE